MKKITLVVDTPDWAYANIARQVQKCLGHMFEVIVLPITVVDNNPIKAILASKDSDLVHFFWREALRTIDSPSNLSYLAGLGLNWGEFESRYLAPKKLTVSVYDHLFTSKSDLRHRSKFFHGVAGYTVSSSKLFEIYQASQYVPDPTSLIQDGVDLELFTPRKQTIGSSFENEIKIGWVGNSEWGDAGDHKGLHTIVRPALEILRNEGRPVVENFADRKLKHTPMHQMPDYYAGVDLLVCASKNEGTPNPVLEAMACGVPVVTTDVGIVREVFGQLQSQFIVDERSPVAFAEKIGILLDDESAMQELSRQNRESVSAWGWDVQAKKFGQFFSSILASQS